jgi:soluble lytic murein transglycosylase-like protein
MRAKSFPNLLRVLDTGTLAQWGRNTVSFLVLAASLAALFLILLQLHGHLFQGAYARILPVQVFKATSKPAAAPVLPAADPDEERQRAIAEFLATRYRVSQDVAVKFVGIAYVAGNQIGLDPLLILAVMAVESRFNPIAESLVGAKGLMQIIPKYHGDKLEEFGGEKAVFDPATNIVVGSQILKEYLRRTGNLSMALQMYAGALNDEQDIYTTRVMSEKLRLQTVLNRNAARWTEIKTASASDVLRDAPRLAQ